MTEMTDRYQARKQFFNERAAQWLDLWYRDPATGECTRYSREFDRLFSLLQLAPDASVLDVGCGSGVLVPHILKRLSPAGKLLELDCAEQMIEENRRLHTDSRITFVAGDLLTVGPYLGPFDLVLCFACFPHLDRKADAVRTMAETLRQDGCLAIAHFRSSEELNGHHSKHEAVAHDMLPDAETMRDFITVAGMRVDCFLDQPGFYILLASKA